MVHDTETNSNRRIRRPGMHRGWALKHMTPERMARDIANSILADHARPDAPKIRVASEFTSCIETLRLVDAILASER